MQNPATEPSFKSAVIPMRNSLIRRCRVDAKKAGFNTEVPNCTLAQISDFVSMADQGPMKWTFARQDLNITERNVQPFAARGTSDHI